MLARAARLALPLVVPLAAIGCASPQTVVHFSAPAEAPWEVRDGEGERLCALPCTVELEDREAVVVARSDGGTQFVLHQEHLGPGAFSGSVRVARERGPGSLAAEVVSGALAGAGAALERGGDRREAVAGAVLSKVGAVILAASEAASARREELWVERTSAP